MIFVYSTSQKHIDIKFGYYIYIYANLMQIFVEFRMFLAQRSKLIVHSSRRCIGSTSVRLKGHSHWQNIKSTKEAGDKARSITIGRQLQRVQSAVKRKSIWHIYDSIIHLLQSAAVLIRKRIAC
jgi:hypothetical protein